MGKGNKKGRNQKQQGGGRPAGKAKSNNKQELEIVPSLAKRGRKQGTGKSLPVPGLMNLGNTCFFNAVIQNLARTDYFKQRLAEVVKNVPWRVELTPKCALPTLSLTITSAPESFTTILSQFLNEMSTNGRGTLNPRPVFDQICSKAPRFRGYQQQDGQELLRYLLDALKSEEVHRMKRAILEAYNVMGAGKVSKRTLTENDRKAIKEYGLSATMTHTFVEDVFGGKLVSTVTCQECLTCSEMLEEFLDLSLPVPAEKDQKNVSGGSSSKSKGKVTKSRVGSTEEEEEEKEEVLGGRGRNEYQPKMSKHQLKKARREERKKSRKAKTQTLSLENFRTQTSTGTEERGTQQQQQQEEQWGEEEELQQREEEEQQREEEQKQEQVEQQEEEEEEGHQEQKQHEEEADPSQLPNKNSDRQVAEEDSTTLKLPSSGLEASLANHSLESPPLNQVSSPQLDNNGKTIIPPLAPEEDETRTTAGAHENENVSSSQLSNLLPSLSISETSSTQYAALEAADPSHQPDTLQTDQVSLEESGAVCQRQDSTYPSARKHTSQHNPFSLEACLSKFCSMEFLTGEDKFACEVCTKKWQQQQEQNMASSFASLSPARQPSVDQLSGSGEVELSESGELGTSNKQGVMTEEGKVSGDEMELESGQQDTEVAPCSANVQNQKTLPPKKGRNNSTASDDVGGEKERDGDSIVPSSASSSATDFSIGLQQQEDEEELESAKESDGLSDSTSSPSEKEKDKAAVVFCEATKQLQVASMPPVLCLHLKRFTQQGRSLRSLRKNSSHVDFPLLLDVAPYCTHSCREMFDSAGQLLYSLYGIVEHSGGMHGGHYTAYVRLRPEMSLTRVKDTRAQEDEVHCSSTDSNVNSSFVADGIGDGPHRQFDTKLAEQGQWYYVSDSHVRTATVSEVLKAQGYILFYERLPFV